MTKKEYMKGICLLHAKFSEFDEQTLSIWHFSKREIEKLFYEVHTISFSVFAQVCIDLTKQEKAPTINKIKELLGISDCVPGQLKLEV